MNNKIKIIFLSISVLTTFMYGSLSGKKIGLDPGHGGHDSGAVGPTQLTESSTALAIAFAAKKYLVRDGAAVTMTRESQGGSDHSLAKKVSILNAAHVHKAVSIHLNAASPSANRTMDFVYCGMCSKSAGHLAVNLVEQLVESTNLSKGASTTKQLKCANHFGNTKCPNNKGVGQARIYVLRRTAMPASLVEVSFISNPAEEQRLKDNNYINKQGYAIYAGIAEEYGVTPLPIDGGNTNACHMTNISLNQNLQGQYESGCKSNVRKGSYAKFFKFTLPSQRKVTITLDADYAADAYLYLKHSNWSQIKADDDSAGKRDSRITRTLPAGTYILEATTYRKNKTGNFKISIK